MQPTGFSLGEKLRVVPLLRALVPMTAGVVFGTLVPVPLYVWITAAVVCALSAWLTLHLRAFPTLYVTLAILFFGAALAHAHTPEPVVPQSKRVWMEVLLTDNPTRREGARSAPAHGVVTRWQPDGTTPSGKWRSARERLLVSLDTMWRMTAGDRVVFRGYINPVSDTANSYSRLMRARGYTGRTYISQYSRPTVTSTGTKTPGLWAKKLQSTATSRLQRLQLPPDGIAVASAMTTGDRASITPTLRRAYSRTGASHLLAVSGLHVGIVFLIINALFYMLPLARGGHIAKNIAAVVAIWSYAVLSGGSPSAIRAAFMFTGAQIALAASQTRSPVNIMCGTATVMLAVRPGLLFDISFQLSFIAVAAIMAWFGPLYRLVASRWRVLNALWATLLVGFTASVATMPLVSHTFGILSPAGIVLNPLVIITAHLTVVFSLLWIAAPVPWLESVFRWLVGGPAWLQNRTVELVSAVPGAAVEWTMPLWGVFAAYGVMTILTTWYYARPRRRESFMLQR